jgi:hypothetical protein
MAKTNVRHVTSFDSNDLTLLTVIRCEGGKLLKDNVRCSPFSFSAQTYDLCSGSRGYSSTLYRPAHSFS